MCTGIDTDVSYPPAPSTPPEPAPHDPSLGNSKNDPRSSMGSSSGVIKSLSNTSSSSSAPLGQHRLVKASTMPSTGNHPSLEDVTTCRTYYNLENLEVYIVLVLRFNTYTYLPQNKKLTPETYSPVTSTTNIEYLIPF